LDGDGITCIALSLATKPDGDLNETFGAGTHPVAKAFTGSLGTDVIGDGEILSGLFTDKGVAQPQGFTFVLERPNFIAGAIGTDQYGTAAPIVLFGVRQRI
jgi:hypothetical protein